jgi:uncharacterized cupredoxin-like copper-binding protein
VPANLSCECADRAAHVKSTPAAATLQPRARAVARVGIAFLAAALYSPIASVTPVAAAERAGEPVSQQQPRTRKKSAAPADITFGHEGDPRKVKRTVSVETSDAMRYFPDQIHVKKGQTLRFVVRNAGELPHEMVLGTMDDLKKHAAMLKKGGAMPHDAPNVVHVEPGGTGRLVWHFTKAGEFYYGCLVPGHFEAGMIGTVVVR